MGSLIENRVLVLDAANPSVGPIAPATDVQLSPRSNTYLSLDHNIKSKIDTNFIPTINAQKESAQQYINDKYVNFTGREQIMPTVVQQISLKGNEQWNNLSIKDAKTTTNETTLYSASGNPERQHDGTKFWTYKDLPNTTTNETTLYSASGNPERQHDGTKFWTYKDLPNTTTSETTLYSYAGDVAGIVSNHLSTNREQFTGSTITEDIGGIKKTYKSSASGVTHIPDRPVIVDYVPGLNGYQNIQLDPNDAQGTTALRLDRDILNTEGPGVYLQGTPNAENQQQISPELIGKIKYNGNKEVGLNNRSTALYCISGLKENPCSIYHSENAANNEIPMFFMDANAEDTSGISIEAMPEKAIKPAHFSNDVFNVFENNLYDQTTLKLFNRNATAYPEYENPMLYFKKVPEDTAQFMGKGYSGNAYNAESQCMYLDTDSKDSSTYLDYFSPNGCLKQY